MGISGQSVTLANSIIGVGILAMPFCFQQCGVVLAIVMLLLSGIVSRLTCYFLLKAAIIARRRNFEFLAFHVFGSMGKLAVEIGIIGFLMGTCIAYFVVVGDLGPQIIAKMFSINQSSVLRTSVMVIVSLVCVLPLGLLRNVDSLGNVSAATIGFYICLVLKVITEAAAKLINGEWSSQMELWKPAGILQCMPIFSMALFCQTQLFEIFESLPSLLLEKMSAVTKNAINICTAVYLMVGLFGYIAFSGQPISGNILVSLSPTMASDVIKLGFVMSLAFSFPLIIFPCRASLYSLLYRKVHPSQHDHIINHSIPETTFRCITVAIITVALLVSLMIPNIELVLGLVGSTIGVLICVVFPTACFVNVTIKNTNERVLAKIILCLGIIVMVLGTYANLQAAESNIDRYDDKQITQERIDKIVEDFFESKKIMEKSNDVSLDLELKPIDKVANNEILKNGANGISKDSEAQPPNPVPPELVQAIEEKSPKEKPRLLKSSIPEKVRETNFNLEEGGGDKESVIHISDATNKTEINNKLSNEINKIDKAKDEEAIVESSINQEQIDLLKQQALMETIKQHGEEQKELLKEQREILNEIKKTKLELQKKKKEQMNSSEAKKIAVESIQKIADIAIESLGGAADKPSDNTNLNDLQKVEIKNMYDNLLKENAKKFLEIKEPEVKVDNNLGYSKLERSLDMQQEVLNLPKVANSEDLDNNKEKIINIKEIQEPNKLSGILGDKEHIHSIDEPKSYIHGENLQLQSQLENQLPSNNKPIDSKVPILMAMNQNAQADLSNNNQVNIPVSDIKKVIESEVNPLVAEKNGVGLKQLKEEHARIKRDILDCSKELIASPERQKCEYILKSINNKEGSDSMAVNSVEFPRGLKAGSDVIHHSRSIKSTDGDERLR